MGLRQLIKNIDFLGEKMRFNISSEALYGTCVGFTLTILFIFVCLFIAFLEYKRYNDDSQPITIS